MPNLNESTLFGERQDKSAVRWPEGYGNDGMLLERTLFGQVAEWGLHPWPEGYGGTP